MRSFRLNYLCIMIPMVLALMALLLPSFYWIWHSYDVCSSIQRFIPRVLHPSSLRGGAPSRQAAFTVDELLSFEQIFTPFEDSSTIASLEFVEYISSLDFANRLASDSMDHVVYDVPLPSLVNRLPKMLLRNVAHAHNISVSRSSRNSRIDIVSLLNSHVCNSGCAHYFSLFKPKHKAVPRKTTADAQWLLSFPVVSGREIYKDCVFEFVNICTDVASISESESLLRIPLVQLLKHLERWEFNLALRAHKIPIDATQCELSDLVQAVVRHDCSTSKCPDVFALFRNLSLPLSTPPVECDSDSFPPKPLPIFGMARICQLWAAAFSRENVCELPCAVCARMKPARETSMVAKESLNLEPLMTTGEGVAFIERKTDDAPFGEVDEPLLFPGGCENEGGIPFLRICKECLPALKKGRRPKHSLANGLWVGDIPEELRALNYVERLVVALERRNACTVRVAKLGHRKLTANAVVFAQPVHKFYTHLPPPRKDIEECLSIIFIGSCIPDGKEFRQTPFIVRRDVVLAALKWLIRNHEDYRGIVISEENLNTYVDGETPVCIIRRNPEAGEETVDAEAQPCYTVIDANVDDQTKDCAFAVHGLSSEQYVSMTLDQRKVRALCDFRLGFPSLAYGHLDDPSRTYNNPQLYPRMFPWLFPYGCGGFGNRKMKVKLPLPQQVKHFLEYADRRFQTDENFPFIAFNHKQILSSSRGGTLLAERKNFSHVAERILDLDTVALQRLVDRGEQGLPLNPSTDEEKACLEVLTLVDVVGRGVPASASQRKDLRNEIRSLIIARNVPLFFITFSPVDSKHPLCLYYCGESIDVLDPESIPLDSKTRLKTISNNPVACAKFFDHVVRTFIDVILGAGDGVTHDGVFGPVTSYYGTVEEQGRKTLHLHLLLWIKNSLSPQEIRDRILSDPLFRSDIIEWLESCHKGEYSLSTEGEISQRLSTARGADAAADAMGDDAFLTDISADRYRDPTAVLPKPPPSAAFLSAAALEDWHRSVCNETDDIVFLSNRHDKRHGKGCRRGKEQYCRARFPREVREQTEVDPDTGAVRMKKRNLGLTFTLY